MIPTTVPRTAMCLKSCSLRYFLWNPLPKRFWKRRYLCNIRILWGVCKTRLLNPSPQRSQFSMPGLGRHLPPAEDLVALSFTLPTLREAKPPARVAGSVAVDTTAVAHSCPPGAGEMCRGRGRYQGGAHGSGALQTPRSWAPAEVLGVTSSWVEREIGEDTAPRPPSGPCRPGTT